MKRKHKPLWGHVALAGAISTSLALTVALTGPRIAPVLAANKPAASKPGTTPTPGWDPQAAARYLDSREAWWQAWPPTHKEQGTYCISCHTQAAYSLARPALRQSLGEPGPTGAERIMLDSIEKRVRLWSEVQPFYSNGKEIGSRNAESVLNAFILSSYDRSQGHLSAAARAAFANAWALQSQSGSIAGAWIWQNFHYTPWESPESEYHGAALMAVAAGRAPDDYRDDPKIAANLALLRGYLRSHYGAQPMLNQIIALWASAWFPDLLTRAQHDNLLAALYSRQRPDGGWSLTDLGTWHRVDKTPLETRPDGYATGLSVLVLEEAAPPPIHSRTPTEEHIARGIAWLKANQDKTTGAWPAWSLNKNRDPKSDPAAPFMTDAATSYAVLALEEEPHQQAPPANPPRKKQAAN